MTSRLASLPLAGDAILLLLGGFLTVVVVHATVTMGPTLPVGGLFALFALAALVISFVAIPHVAVAALIPVFALLPMVNTLWVPTAGPVKEIAAVGAFAAVALLTIERHRLRTRAPIDMVVAACIFGLLAL